MQPTKIEPCTRVLGRPEGTLEEDCGELQISDARDPIWGNVMRSAWVPTPEERAAIANGAPVIVQIVGHSHPVLAVFTGEWKGGLPPDELRLKRLEEEIPPSALEWDDAKRIIGGPKRDPA